MVCRVLVTEVLDMSSFMKKMTSDSAENRALQVNLLLLNNFDPIYSLYWLFLGRSHSRFLEKFCHEMNIFLRLMIIINRYGTFLYMRC